MEIVLETNNQLNETTKARHKRIGWITSELAQALGVDPSRVRQWLIAGTIKGFKLGRAWIISDMEAQRFIADYKSR